MQPRERESPYHDCNEGVVIGARKLLLIANNGPDKDARGGFMRRGVSLKIAKTANVAGWYRKIKHHLNR